jgi:hypothetical protein
MKIRHKINWERVVSALAALKSSWDKSAIQTLEDELLPKYETVKAKRAKLRAQVYASRKKLGRKHSHEYDKHYRETHREQLRKYNREYQRKRRHKE